MSNQTREESAANYIKGNLANESYKIKIIQMISEHRIEPLMNQLAESLIYKQPIDPRAYLIDLLQELIEAREKNTPPNGLLDRTNIAAIFGLIDIMGRGRYVMVYLRVESPTQISRETIIICKTLI